MTTVACTRDTLLETITKLRQGGERGEERVVLWLSSAAPREPALVVEVYEPDQVNRVDRFLLPSASMRNLLDHLRSTRRRIVAQVHTHPGVAFHSRADAEWAIIRHVGALSLVLPRFAAATSPETFLEEAKTYEYSTEGTWEHRPNVGSSVRVTVTG